MAANQVTILHDAFGKSSALKKDWGFAALIEYDGLRILFDTGNNATVFRDNVAKLAIDLSALDLVAISHRHGDHTSGINHLLTVNPKVAIYAPKELYGVFGSSLPGVFYPRCHALPSYMQYYDGQPPPEIRHGTPWPEANFHCVDAIAEIAPGVSLIPTVSENPGTRELTELTLSIATPSGQVLIAGCSHPGIDKIVEAAIAINPRIHLIAGGFHLVVAKDPDIENIVMILRDKFKVAYVAPGHCTGEPTFTALKKAFGDRYLYAGLGTALAIGATPRAISGAGQQATTGLEEDDVQSYRTLFATSVEDEPTRMGRRE